MSDMVLVPLSDAEELAWQERALCAQTDPEAFFPEKGGSTREADAYFEGEAARWGALIRAAKIEVGQ